MEAAMFRDITLDKFLYDLFIALLTGIVTGVLTGLYVDRRIKSRERLHLAPATNTMYVEVVDAINQLTKDTLSPRFFTATKMCEFSNAASAYFIVELTDQTVFDWNTTSYRELREELAESLNLDSQDKDKDATLQTSQTSRSRPRQMDPLAKAKQRLDDVFQKHGPILESELRDRLAILYKQLVTTLQLGDRVRDWQKGENRTLFAEQLIEVLHQANNVRRDLYPLGKIQTLDDLLKRIG
jgi:hypothetical protein